jgi:hypothetical protein
VWGYELRVRGYERHGSFEGLTLQPSKLRRASLDVIEHGNELATVGRLA